MQATTVPSHKAHDMRMFFSPRRSEANSLRSLPGMCPVILLADPSLDCQISFPHAFGSDHSSIPLRSVNISGLSAKPSASGADRALMKGAVQQAMPFSLTTVTL